MGKFGNSGYVQKDGKILHQLKKPKAKNHILIVGDLGMDNDGWFITVRFVANKSGKTTNEYCITRKNVKSWVDQYIRDGYTDELNQ